MKSVQLNLRIKADNTGAAASSYDTALTKYVVENFHHSYEVNVRLSHPPAPGQEDVIIYDDDEDDMLQDGGAAKRAKKIMAG